MSETEINETLHLAEAIMIAQGIHIELGMQHYQLPCGQYVVLNNGLEASDCCFINAPVTTLIISCVFIPGSSYCILWCELLP